ncbi:hypothetical protein Pcac1_g7786 [Phytophthora cactorum]|nr:hypothetical protein Pcac1_g7786 [Phytophthora cactorum]
MAKTFEVHSAINAGPAGYLIHESDRLQLNTYQAFVRSAANPSSDFRSLLLMHMTGTGKTITALATATEYVRQPWAEISSVSSTLCLLREEAKALREMEHHLGRSRVVNDHLELLRKRYQRRIANRKHVGIYQVDGYRQFANLVSTEGAAEKQHGGRGLGSAARVGPRGSRALEHELRRRSLFICDEVHNLYRNGSLNTYGVVIGLVFEHFFETLPPGHPDHGAVRSLLLSATPLTASALEVVPIAQLLTGEKLNSSELFTPVLGVEQLTPQGAAKVRQVVSAKISYIMDDIPTEYATVSFAGEEIPGIRYARFLRCAPKGHQLLCLEHWADCGGGGANEEFGNNMAKDIALPGVPVRPHGVLYSQHISGLQELPELLTVRVDPAHGLYESQVLALPPLQQ